MKMLQPKSSLRQCDQCKARSTPMWRRGPGGKGTLCNACGVRWSLRRKGNTITEETDENTRSLSQEEGYWNEDTEEEGGYYCRYCKQTWPLSFFRNSQQFGAHCSNCSRKKRQIATEDKPPALTTRYEISKKRKLQIQSSPTPEFEGENTDQESSHLEDSNNSLSSADLTLSKQIGATKNKTSTNDILLMSTQMTSKMKMQQQDLKQLKKKIAFQFHALFIDMLYSLDIARARVKLELEESKRKGESLIHDFDSELQNLHIMLQEKKKEAQETDLAVRGQMLNQLQHMTGLIEFSCSSISDVCSQTEHTRQNCWQTLAQLKAELDQELAMKEVSLHELLRNSRQSLASSAHQTYRQLDSLLQALRPQTNETEHQEKECPEQSPLPVPSSHVNGSQAPSLRESPLLALPTMPM